MKNVIWFLALVLCNSGLFAQYYSVTDVMKMALPMPANMVTATREEASGFGERHDSVSSHIEAMQKSYKHPFICSAEVFYKKMEPYYKNTDKINDFLTNQVFSLNQELGQKTITLETECWNKQQPLLARLEQLREKSSNPAQFQKELEMEKEIRRQVYALKVEFATKKVEAYKSYVKQVENGIAKLQPLIEAVDKTAIPEMKVPITRSMALEVGKYFVDMASGTFDYNVGPPIE
jgi:hypothetical protein